MENNEKKEESWKVYGLLLEGKETVFISVQYSTCLEDACNQAKLEWERINPAQSGVNNPLIGSKIGIFTFKTLDQLNQESKLFKSLYTEQVTKELQKREEALKVINNFIKELHTLTPPPPIPPVPPTNNTETPKEDEKMHEIRVKNEKNILMAKILKEGDEKIFEEYKSALTEAEQQYLKERLNKNVKES